VYLAGKSLRRLLRTIYLCDYFGPRAAQLSRTQYKEGAVNFLDVIDADRTVLQSQRAAAQLAGLQAVSTVNLIRALGGVWSTAPALANTNE
jgi:outer membrane protein, multidrug efflux system